jgi:hypothetical protein
MPNSLAFRKGIGLILTNPEDQIMDLNAATTALLVGILATDLLDLWALCLRHVLGLPTTNWGLVGRWLAGIPAGNFRNEAIGALPAVPFERPLGWLTYYLVGISYAAIYLLAVGTLAQPPALYTAAIFGVATVLAPWLILQPGLGLGFFASGAPKPNLTRTLNLIAHLVFGIGIYLGWRLITAL